MQSDKTMDYSNKTPVSDVYSFDYLIEKNCLYVDKTEYLYRLVSSQKKLYFFSRPRRFGKSLTLSTLKAIFQGRKELFKGLYIENQPYEWKKYPVIHLDMGSVTAIKAEELESDLISLLKWQAEKYNIELDGDRASQKFIELVQKLYDRNGEVVILIDEYDKPILNNILSPDIERIQTLLKGFYSVLKTCEPYERFAFITGVGKFLKVSIFSDLNNLNDISMSKEYAAMCGYAEQEIEEYFHERLAKIALEQETDYDDLKKSIKDWYDGYRFSRGEQRVYNPVSFTKFLSEDGEFSNYWFETGTPSILVRLFKENCVDFEKLFNEYQMEDVFTAFMPAKVKFVALMYQTGYLTIKDTRTIFKRTAYKLGFPNIEVEESFYRYLSSI